MGKSKQAPGKATIDVGPEVNVAEIKQEPTQQAVTLAVEKPTTACLLRSAVNVVYEAMRSDGWSDRAIGAAMHEMIEDYLNTRDSGVVSMPQPLPPDVQMPPFQV